MGSNSELLEGHEESEMIHARVETAARLGHSALRDREQQELLDFALHEMTSDWFYDIELNGAEIEGIGIQGAMELASFRAEQGYPIRLQNGVELLDVERHGLRGIQATVVAREGRTLREGVGVCFFPYMMEIPAVDSDPLFRSGETPAKIHVPDPRADRKALSIAKRNAILDLIPEIVVQSILANRATAVPQNEARKANQLAASRNRHAVPVRTTTTAQLRKDVEEAGPYDEPSRLQSTARTPVPASTRQIVRLLQLADHPKVGEQIRATIKQKLDTDLSYALAEEWIPLLEAQTKEAV